MSAMRTVIGLWTDLGEDAGAVRTQVFVKEQGIAPELEWDALDAKVMHAVVYNEEGIPIGTGRLITPSASGKPAKIGRMAVLAQYRRQGVGDDILDALITEAMQAGYTSIELSAQAYVSDFYVRHGFEKIGPLFDEVGIPHQKMVLSLKLDSL
jgi:predicted GNAT family N-acyltransferase